MKIRDLHNEILGGYPIVAGRYDCSYLIRVVVLFTKFVYYYFFIFINWEKMQTFARGNYGISVAFSLICPLMMRAKRAKITRSTTPKVP